MFIPEAAPAPSFDRLRMSRKAKTEAAAPKKHN